MSNKMLDRFREYINVTRFNAVKIGLASPDKVLSLSYGEVKKIETITETPITTISVGPRREETISRYI